MNWIFCDAMLTLLNATRRR